MRGFTDTVAFSLVLIAAACAVAWAVYLTVLAGSYTYQVFDPPAACACGKCGDGCCQANPQDACPCTP